MNYLFSIVMLLLMLVPQSQDFPDEFYQIPEHVRDKATVVIAGTFAQGRGPCIWRPDGIRMWALESRFDVTKVYRGQVGGKSIKFNRAMLPKAEEVSEKLEVGRGYLVLLRPSEESMKVIKTGEYVPSREALSGEEVVAVVELK